MRNHRRRGSEEPALSAQEMLRAIESGAVAERTDMLHGRRPCWISWQAAQGWVRIGHRAKEMPADTSGPIWIGFADAHVLRRLIEDGQVRHTRYGYKTPTTRGGNRWR